MESFNYFWAARIKTKIVKTFNDLLHIIAYMAEENHGKKQLRKQDVHIIEKQKMVIVHIRNK